MSRLIDADALQLAIVEEGQANKRKKYSIGDIWELTGAEIREVINSLPTIQPKTGKWIYCEDSTADCVDGYRCDQCGFFVPWDYKHKGIDYIKEYNFCPNCEARMEVDT